MKDQTTRQAGVIGWPIDHSLSPRLHRYWLEQYGIDGAYSPLAVKPEDLSVTIRKLAGEGFAGFNITVPHKEAAFKIVDKVNENAKRIGAINTVIVHDNGLLEGRNTDSFGFMENLKANAPSWKPEHGPVVILGAGGAARAVCAALLDGGASELRLVNRSQARAEDLAGHTGGAIKVYPWLERNDVLDGASLLVNTTTLGMVGKPPLDLALDRLPQEAVVNDIVYTPLRTPLLKAAADNGNPVIDGLGMLLHQGRPGFAAWFGVDPEVTTELRDFMEQGLGS